MVNLGAIRQGMKRFQFLLNCCEPGTIPDASILAAALDLVSCWKNLGIWFPISMNSAHGGKHESLILTPTVGLCLVLFCFLNISGKRRKRGGSEGRKERGKS